jgi:ribosomal protein S27AE
MANDDDGYTCGSCGSRVENAEDMDRYHDHTGAGGKR